MPTTNKKGHDEKSQQSTTRNRQNKKGGNLRKSSQFSALLTSTARSPPAKYEVKGQGFKRKKTYTCKMLCNRSLQTERTQRNPKQIQVSMCNKKQRALSYSVSWTLIIFSPISMPRKKRRVKRERTTLFFFFFLSFSFLFHFDSVVFKLSRTPSPQVLRVVVSDWMRYVKLRQKCWKEKGIFTCW